MKRALSFGLVSFATLAAAAASCGGSTTTSTTGTGGHGHGGATGGATPTTGSGRRPGYVLAWIRD